MAPWGPSPGRDRASQPLQGHSAADPADSEGQGETRALGPLLPIAVSVRSRVVFKDTPATADADAVSLRRLALLVAGSERQRGHS